MHPEQFRTKWCGHSQKPFPQGATQLQTYFVKFLTAIIKKIGIVYAKYSHFS